MINETICKEVCRLGTKGIEISCGFNTLLEVLGFVVFFALIIGGLFWVAWVSIKCGSK